MKSRHSVLLGTMFFAGLIFAWHSVHACSLCIKEGVSNKDISMVCNATMENVGGIDFGKYFEACLWCTPGWNDFEKALQKGGHEPQNNTSRVFIRRTDDMMTSILAYMIGESLKYSDFKEQREMAKKYIAYSYEIAIAYGITREAHETILRSLSR